MSNDSYTILYEQLMEEADEQGISEREAPAWIAERMQERAEFEHEVQMSMMLDDQAKEFTENGQN